MLELNACNQLFMKWMVNKNKILRGDLTKMGYSIIGRHRKTDDSSIFYEECMYAYMQVFKKCFGRDLSEFSGRVTKKKIEEFKIGLYKFKSDKSNNIDNRYMLGDANLSNISYDKLCDRLSELLELMENKQICYLHIG